MPNVRIEDVAAHAGVSSATITRVVNNKGYVAPKTKERVKKSIEKLGYIPNRIAKSLKSSKSGIIGNVLPIVTNFVFTRISQSLKDAVMPYGFHLLPMYAEGDRKQEDRLIQELVGRMVEGIIFINRVLVSRSMLQEVMKKIPIILLERPIDIKGADKVFWDNLMGSALAVSHFIARGHRDIGFIGGKIGDARDEADRFTGFDRSLKEAGLGPKAKNIQFAGEYHIEHGYKAMKHIIEKNRRNRPTGCYITSDILLCGALQYLYDAGLRVPEDISIISHDDTYSAMCSPPITTIAIPYEELGRAAISLFWERREQNRRGDKTVILKPFVLDRGSVLDLKNSNP
jgi:LacI family transcriptional regulator